MSFIRHKILFLLVCTALIASSCGGPAQTDSEIATAVALTVEAQESPTLVPAPPTLTPVPTFPAEASPEPDPTSTSQPVVSNPGCTVSASLVSENPPDDVLLKPGEYFWKTWTLLNTGSCIWDTSYSLIFWSGERMGGLSSYPLTEIVRPEETLEVSIYLQAPAAEGTSTGYWRLKSPWGADFGVGPLSSSFYVQIGVAEKPKYGIAKVEQELIRNPAEGCPANVRYTVYATITSNGPLEFEYFWDQSDGNESGVRALELTEAGSITIEREWMLGRGATQNPRWIQLIITAPQYHEYERMTFLNNCP
jgi:hypothetical protein